jgi:hypothetical protein
MARQSGPIKYVGTLGDIRHFKIKGQRGHFAGLKGGPSGDRVLNGEEFARTRENMAEFGACARAGKSIRIALSELLKHMADPQLTGRLTAIMKRINLEDGSEARGRRAVLITEAPQHLYGLDFNRNISFNTIYRGEYLTEAAVERNQAVLTIPSFNPANLVRSPNGTTHFRFVHALAGVSNLGFNEETGVFEPLEPAMNETAAIAYSNYLPVSAVTESLKLEAAFPNAPTVNGDVAVIQCIGIEFYQQVSGLFYRLSAGNCMKIETVM